MLGLRYRRATLVAIDCRGKKPDIDGGRVPAPGRDRVTAMTCYKCGKVEHIALRCLTNSAVENVTRRAVAS
ncbi:hypothetical protein EVAR_92635_1 [Eumeta japonica]|uniref:CCHC-type domain-containing protein n=1 Tax=Eumeta variegata TaxID=151549 RepID=A0A4C1SZI1_EUMVA|nr:hypothetical protein EVAR_92635_1 [Eumeta japonica]